MSHMQFVSNNQSRQMVKNKFKRGNAATRVSAKWVFSFFSLAAAVFGTASAWADAAPQSVEVAAGSQRVIKLTGPAARVAIGSGDIADIRTLGKRELLLQGVKPGTTSLLVWLKGAAQPLSYQVQVDKAVDPAVLSDFPGLRLKATGDLLLLDGHAADVREHEQAVQIARHATGDDKTPVEDNTTMPFSSEVQINVRVVEFSRKVLKQAGINLLSNTSGFTFGTFAPSSLSKVTANSSGITAESSLPISQALNLVVGASSEGVASVLSLLEGNGFARTLAEPSLVTLSGQTASFLAGGEFPVPVPQALGQTTIEYKPYGIRLDVSPTILAKDRIAIKIAPEVSDLDFNNAITINGVAVPSLTTRRANTSIELGDGESFVIGGLVSQNVVKNLNKIPGLGDIPVLGAFFKSASLSRQDKELLIIVTPHLVRPMAANTQLGPMPGADVAGYNPSLWDMLLRSDREEAAHFTGLSR